MPYQAELATVGTQEGLKATAARQPIRSGLSPTACAGITTTAAPVTSGSTTEAWVATASSGRCLHRTQRGDALRGACGPRARAGEAAGRGEHQGFRAGRRADVRDAAQALAKAVYGVLTFDPRGRVTAAPSVRGRRERGRPGTVRRPTSCTGLAMSGVVHFGSGGRHPQEVRLHRRLVLRRRRHDPRVGDQPGAVKVVPVEQHTPRCLRAAAHASARWHLDVRRSLTSAHPGPHQGPAASGAQDGAGPRPD